MEVVQYADGLFDATAIASAFGKKAVEYLRLPRTIEYVEELAKELKLPTGLNGSGVPEILLELIEYLRDAQRRCECCRAHFSSDELLKQHLARRKRRSTDARASETDSMG